MTTKTKNPKSNRKILNLFFILLLNIYSFGCAGQINFSLSQPRLKITDDSLMITYDILGARKGDKFIIQMEITDDAGKVIEAKALKGDVGENIKAGTNKQIAWNFIADEIFINNTVNVEIIAEKITINEPETTYARVKTGKQLLKSAIFPGWGSTSLSHGKPYWILGVAGMGCVATSVYFNIEANSSYDDYLNSSDNDIMDYYDDAVRLGDISNIFAFSAAGIWIIDLGIVAIQASSMNKSYRKSKKSTFSINTKVDKRTDTPLISLQYKF